MRNRKIIGAVAMSAALATGGVVGATLGTPGSSGAQDAPATTVPTDGTTTPDSGGRGGKHGLGGGLGLDAAAEALGITADELRTELQDGTTIAEVAEAKGVDRQQVIDAMVAAAEARLDEQKTALPERVAGIVDGTIPTGGPGGGRGGPGGRGGFGLDAAAEALGITADELRTELQDGTTIAEVAEAEGVDLQKVIDALVAEAKTKIAASVADGTLTQEQADERLADLVERTTERVSDPHQGRGPGAGRPDGDRPAAPPTDDTTTTTEG